jgi:hypothetical protein
MWREDVRTGFWWGNPEGKRLLGRPRRRWEDNIKLDIHEVRWGGTDWIDLAQGWYRWQALLIAVMNLQFP